MGIKVSGSSVQGSRGMKYKDPRLAVSRMFDEETLRTPRIL